MSHLARLEVPAAVWRKHRLGELSSKDAATLVDEFEWDWFGEADAEAHFAVVGATDEVMDLSARTVARHPLHAFDAVQLGSALAARGADPALETFACLDEALAEAARAEGFRALP